jgi:hypothetical protein
MPPRAKRLRRVYYLDVPMGHPASSVRLMVIWKPDNEPEWVGKSEKTKKHRYLVPLASD